MSIATPEQREATDLGLRQQRVKTAGVEQEFNDSQKDRSILQEVAQSGADFMTSDGLKETIKSLQGKVSPGTLDRLMQRQSSLQQGELKIREMFQKQKLEDLEQAVTEREFLMPQVGQLLQIYDNAKNGKGEQFATETFNGGLQALIQGYQNAMAPGGKTPLVSPETLQGISKMSPDDLRNLYLQSKSYGNLMKSVYEQRRAEKEKAQTDALNRGGSGNWENFVSDDGKVYAHDKKTNIWKRNGEPIGESEVPADIKKMGAKGAGQSSVESGLLPETTEFLAQYAMSSGGKAPPAPPFGQSNNKARADYYNTMARLAGEMGYDGTEAGMKRLQQMANAESLKRLTTQEAAISMGSQEMMMILDAMQQEIQKIGGPDSPKLRGIWNKAATDWAGDPTFSKLNTYAVDFIEKAGRVFSGMSGAGGTPVAFVELAKQITNPNVSLQQIIDQKDAIQKAIEFRKKATEQEKQAVLKSGMMTPKPGSAAEMKTNEPSATTPEAAGESSMRVSPKTQRSRDEEAANVRIREAGGDVNKLRAALKEVNREYANATDGSAKQILMNEKTMLEAAIKKADSKSSDGWREVKIGDKTVKIRVKPQE
jgi:uncharacterized coiled-coil protein SlyX